MSGHGAAVLSTTGRRPRSLGISLLFGCGRLLFVPLLVIGLWYLVSAQVGVFFLPSPHQVAVAVYAGIADGSLLRAFQFTLLNTLISFVLSAVTGSIMGYWLGSSRFVSGVFEPFLFAGYSIPKIVLWPIVFLILGFGDISHIIFGAMQGTLPIMLFTVGGVRAVPRSHFKVAESLQMGQWQKFRKIVFPTSVPYVVAGLRFGFSGCLLGVLVAEMLVHASGAGRAGTIMVDASARHDVIRLLSLVAMTFVIAGVGNAVLMRAQRAVDRGEAVRLRTQSMGVL